MRRSRTRQRTRQRSRTFQRTRQSRGGGPFHFKRALDCYQRRARLDKELKTKGSNTQSDVESYDKECNRNLGMWHTHKKFDLEMKDQPTSTIPVPPVEYNPDPYRTPSYPKGETYTLTPEEEERLMIERAIRNADREEARKRAEKRAEAAKLAEPGSVRVKNPDGTYTIVSAAEMASMQQNLQELMAQQKRRY